MKRDQIAQLHQNILRVAQKNSACKKKIIHKNKAIGVSSNRAKTTKSESAIDSVDSVKSLLGGNANGYRRVLLNMDATNKFSRC